jgi:hypothetical protein
MSDAPSDDAKMAVRLIMIGGKVRKYFGTKADAERYEEAAARNVFGTPGRVSGTLHARRKSR